MYDFDKTLSTTDMQNYSFIPSLGLTPKEFWDETSVFTEKEGVERILSYMYMMVKIAKEKGIKLTRQYLRDCGKNIKNINSVTNKTTNLAEENYHIKRYAKDFGDKISLPFNNMFSYRFFWNTYLWFNIKWLK